jgi:hypothetical protein
MTKDRDVDRNPAPESSDDAPGPDIAVEMWKSMSFFKPTAESAHWPTLTDVRKAITPQVEHQVQSALQHKLSWTTTIAGSGKTITLSGTQAPSETGTSPYMVAMSGNKVFLLNNKDMRLDTEISVDDPKQIKDMVSYRSWPQRVDMYRHGVDALLVQAALSHGTTKASERSLLLKSAEAIAENGLSNGTLLHSDYISAQRRMGHLWQTLGDENKAGESLNKALSRAAQHYGADDQKTAEIRANLIDWQLKQLSRQENINSSDRDRQSDNTWSNLKRSLQITLDDQIGMTKARSTDGTGLETDQALLRDRLTTQLDLAGRKDDANAVAEIGRRLLLDPKGKHFRSDDSDNSIAHRNSLINFYLSREEKNKACFLIDQKTELFRQSQKQYGETPRSFAERDGLIDLYMRAGQTDKSEKLLDDQVTALERSKPTALGAHIRNHIRLSEQYTRITRPEKALAVIKQADFVLSHRETEKCFNAFDMAAARTVFAELPEQQQHSEIGKKCLENMVKSFAKATELAKTQADMKSISDLRMTAISRLSANNGPANIKNQLLDQEFKQYEDDLRSSRINDARTKRRYLIDQFRESQPDKVERLLSDAISELGKDSGPEDYTRLISGFWHLEKTEKAAQLYEQADKAFTSTARPNDSPSAIADMRKTLFEIPREMFKHPLVQVAANRSLEHLREWSKNRNTQEDLVDRYFATTRLGHEIHNEPTLKWFNAQLVRQQEQDYNRAKTDNPSHYVVERYREALSQHYSHNKEPHKVLGLLDDEYTLLKNGRIKGGVDVLARRHYRLMERYLRAGNLDGATKTLEVLDNTVRENKIATPVDRARARAEIWSLDAEFFKHPEVHKAMETMTREFAAADRANLDPGQRRDLRRHRNDAINSLISRPEAVPIVRTLIQQQIEHLRRHHPSLKLDIAAYENQLANLETQ